MGLAVVPRQLCGGARDPLLTLDHNAGNQPHCCYCSNQISQGATRLQDAPVHPLSAVVRAEAAGPAPPITFRYVPNTRYQAISFSRRGDQRRGAAARGVGCGALDGLQVDLGGAQGLQVLRAAVLGTALRHICRIEATALLEQGAVHRVAAQFPHVVAVAGGHAISGEGLPLAVHRQQLLRRGAPSSVPCAGSTWERASSRSFSTLRTRRRLASLSWRSRSPT